MNSAAAMVSIVSTRIFHGATYDANHDVICMKNPWIRTESATAHSLTNHSLAPAPRIWKTSRIDLT
jgi:hypothetical protein